MIVLLVGLGAAVGAPARYLTDRAVQRHFRGRFPLGTLIVNAVASFVFGVFTGAAGQMSAHVSADVQALVTTGCCGALSTFSTFGWETLALSRDGRRSLALLNVLVSAAGCLAAAAAGWALAAT